MKSIFNKKLQTVNPDRTTQRPPLTFLARRTAADVRAAAIARAAVIEVMG